MTKKLDVFKSKMYRRQYYDFGNLWVEISSEKVFIPIQFPTGDLDYVKNVSISSQKYARIVKKIRRFETRLHKSRRLK